MVAPAIQVRAYHPDTDKDFVYSSWLRSYRNAAVRENHSYTESQAYFATQQSLIDYILSSGGEIYIAHPENEPEVILGWICGEVLEDATVLHYCYVKKDWRRWGIARALDAAIRPRDELAVVLTHGTHFAQRCARKYGWIYNPGMLTARMLNEITALRRAA